jgi:putative inorganic carbon (HCO3(-)) transporter
MGLTWVVEHGLDHRGFRSPVRRLQEGVRQLLLRGRPLTWPVLFYGIIFLLTTVSSRDPTRSFWGGDDKHGAVTTLLSLVFFFLVVDAIRTRRQIERLFTALVLGSVPVMFYGIAQFVGLDPLPWRTDSVSPVLSTMGRSNFFGAYLAMIVPFSLFLWVRSNGAEWLRSSDPPEGCDVEREPRAPVHAWRLAVVVVLQITTVLLTQARAAWLSLAAGVLVFFGVVWTSRNRSMRHVWMSLGAVVLAAAVLVGISFIDLTPGRAGAQMDPLEFAGKRYQTIVDRLTIWRGTLQLIPEHPWIGHGPETFVQVFNSRFPPDETWGRANVLVENPHNILLGHLFSTGISGLTAFVIVIVVFFSLVLGLLRQAVRAYDRALAGTLTASTVAFLIQAQFNPDVIVTSTLFLTAAALSLGIRHGEVHDSTVETS